MSTASLVVLLAVTTLVLVAAALCREVLLIRGRERRDLDCYLQWLLEHATGPVKVSLSRPLRSY